jgi:multiple sugar transport system substrate-binding protein
MSKRFVLQVLGVVLIATLVLTACGPTPAPPATEAPKAAEATKAPEPTATQAPAEQPAAKREVVWMVRTSNIENPWEQDVAIPAWEKENPDVKINLLIIDQGDIAVKREAMIAAGEKLDVWSTNWGGDGFASDRARGLLTDLTPLIQRDKLDMSVFIPEVLAIYASEGKQWGLPFLTTGSYIFYNMKLFDEAGIPYPTTDWEDKSWTWDAVLDLAKKLTKNYEDPTTAQYGWVEDRQNIEGPAMLFGKFPWPQGTYEIGFADSIDLHDPVTIQAYQKHYDLIHKEKVSPDSAAAQALATLGGTLQSGRVAMYETGGWGWWAFAPVTPDVEGGFCWGVAPLPWGTPDADKRAVIYTDPWVITRGLQGQELEDAWAFVKFLVREDNARAYMKAANVPPTQSKLQEEWFTQFKCMDPAKNKQVYQGAFKHGLESSNHLLVRWDELNQIWQNGLSPCFDDPKCDMAATLATVEKDTTDALKRIAAEEKK